MNIRRQAQPVPLAVEDLERHWQALGPDGVVHGRRLVGRHDRILAALQEQQRGVDVVDVVQR